MAKKKWKKRLKKIAKAAIIGGALYAGAKALKGRGKGAVSTAGQPVGVKREMPTSQYITKKVKPVVTESKPKIDYSKGNWKGFGHPLIQGNVQKKKAFIEKMTTPDYGSAVASPGQLNPYNKYQNIKGRLGDRKAKGGRVAAKTGGRIRKQFGGGLPVSGTARRDMRSGYYPSDMGMRGGPMYKKGGRVKSMGIAKRGGGAAKR